MRRYLVTFSAASLLFSAGTSAQLIIPGAERKAAGSLSMVLGAGVRAEGMGGAFTAVADDPSAAVTNPAGLAQLSEGEVSISYDRLTIDIEGPSIAVEGTTNSGSVLRQTLQAGSSGDYSHVGFASITLPFAARSQPVVAQLTYRKLSTFPELDTLISGRRRITDPQGGTVVDGPYSSQVAMIPGGDIYDYAISLAGTVVGRFNIGLSANYLEANPQINFRSVESSFVVSDLYQFEFSEVYFDLGVLLKLSDRFSVGGVYHSGFDTEVKTRNDFRAGEGVGQSSRVSSRLSWPSGYAVGLGIRPIEQLTFAVDYSMTDQSSAKIENFAFARAGCGEHVSGSGCDFGQEAPFPGIFQGRQQDSSSIRFGAEYVSLVAKELRLPLRVGYFQEERSASLYGEGGMAPQYHGWSVGGGMGFGKVRIDFGYVQTRGQEKSGPASGELFVPDPEVGELLIPVTIPHRSTQVTTARFLVSVAVRF